MDIYELIEQLGYQDQLSEGICHGIAMMSTQAILAKDFEHFKLRLQKIEELESIDAIVDGMIYVREHTASVEKLRQLKLTQPSSISPEDEHYIFCYELMAFIEGVLLYHTPNSRDSQPFITHALPDQPYKRQIDTLDVFQVLKPEVLNEQDAEIKLKQENYILVTTDDAASKAILATFLKTLKAAPTTVALEVNSTNHAISLHFDGEKWQLTESEIVTELQTEEEVVKLLFEIFYQAEPYDIPSAADEHLTPALMLNFNLFTLDAEPALEPDFQDQLACIAKQSIKNQDLNKLISWGAGGSNLLHLALVSGDEEYAEQLITQGFDNKLQTGNDNLILFYAVLLNSLSFTKQLLANTTLGIDFPQQGHIALYKAASLGYYDMVLLLLANKAEVNILCSNEGFTALHIAMKHGHYKIALALKEHGADMRKLTGFEESMLHLAVGSGNLELVTLCLDEGLDAEATTCFNKTPLYIAIKEEHGLVAQALLQCLINPNTLNSHYEEESETALHLAVRKGRLDLVNILLGARNINVDTLNAKQQTAIHLAASLGRLNILKAIAHKFPSSLNKVDIYGNTALHYAVQGGQLEVIKWLVDHGHDINGENNYGETPLYLAIMNGQLSTVKQLMSLGANTQEIGGGFSAIALAEQLEYKDIISYLLDLNQTNTHSPVISQQSTCHAAFFNSGDQQDKLRDGQVCMLPVLV